ncbi:MAG: hypothetical protein Q9160_002939 [Pyrenula sp. 1 TL-2023]
MAATRLSLLDALEVHVIVDNEVDPISSYTQIPDVEITGRFVDLAMTSPFPADGRGAAKKEMKMESGMLRAIDLIKQAKISNPVSDLSDPITADLHPNRPTYRGFMGLEPISLEADPTFEEITAAGAKVSKSAEAHTVLDDMFLISGEIPRVTPYETGVKRGIRFDEEKGEWESDELILDERLVVCNVKDKGLIIFTGCSHAGVINATKHALTLAGAGADPNTPPPIYAVIGGFHLVGPEEAKVGDTVRDFKELKPKILVPGHCSGWRVKFEIEREMPGALAPCTVGTKFRF